MFHMIKTAFLIDRTASASAAKCYCLDCRASFIRFAPSVIVLAALLATFPLVAPQSVSAQNPAAPDLTTLIINAPVVQPPAGFPPFPSKLDLPVSLSKETSEDAQEETWLTNRDYQSPEQARLSTDSQTHASLGQILLAKQNVVEGFQELKKAIELNNWKPGDQTHQAMCHRMLGDILLEFAFKAKQSGRGTRGMQRLLNAYIEYRQAVFLDPEDSNARAGLVTVLQEIVSIQPTFNNILALASANLVSGNMTDAETFYARCLDLSKLNSQTFTLTHLSEVVSQLAKLQEKQPAPKVSSPTENKNIEFVPGSLPQYVHHLSANVGKADRSVIVKDNETTINIDPAGSLSYYLESVRKNLLREWRLSKIQTEKFPSISVAVDRQGAITELKISASSGNNQVDTAALDVARRVAPFPEPPAEIGEISCTFTNKPESADLSDYMRQLRRKVRISWHPPEDLPQDHVIISFRVHRDGSADNFVIKKTSGSEPANQACLSAIKTSSPFQHLPEGSPEFVDVQFHFDHSLESVQNPG